jgi:sn-2 palmitoyl-lipid 9-desaturase
LTAKELRAADTELIYNIHNPEKFSQGKIDWITLGWMVVMHAGALVAPFFFSWSALGAAVVLHWLTCSIGICLGYHRYLSHRSLKLKTPSEFFVLWAGAISGEGSPLTWASNHRLHHQRSDQKGDPHSPNDGKWWSHLLWLFTSMGPVEQEKLFQRYCPELLDRPMIRFFEKTYFAWIVISGLLLAGLGFATGGVFGAVSFVLWALCLRMVVAYHSTWFVNSATHLWGYRNYETRDRSRNLWWVALVSYGEGWHNNHHAHPSMAPAGHRWWEIDMTWWAIKFLKLIGQASDVKDKLPAKQEG